MAADNKIDPVCTGDCTAKKNITGISCKLAGPELQIRKATIIASLKIQVTGKKELSNGYAFRFSGSNKMLDELIEFIKTERECCDFFTFTFQSVAIKMKPGYRLLVQTGRKILFQLNLVYDIIQIFCSNRIFTAFNKRTEKKIFKTWTYNELSIRICKPGSR